MCSVRDIWTEMQTKNELQSGTNDPRVLCLRIWRSQSQKEQVGYYDSSLVRIYLLSRHDTWQEQSKHRHHRTGWHHKRTRQNKTHREQHLCSRMLQDASGCFKMLWTCVRHMGPVCKQKVQTGASDSKLLCEESGSPNSKNGHWTTVVLILIILFQTQARLVKCKASAIMNSNE